MRYFLLGTLAVFGLVMLLFPYLMWDLTESWKSNASAPTDTYIRLMRLRGIFLIVLGIVGCIVLIFLK